MAADLSSQVPFFIALSMLSFGTHSFLALWIAAKRAGLSSGFPHFAAATAISFACKEKIFHFTEFTASFLACTTGHLHIIF